MRKMDAKIGLIVISLAATKADQTLGATRIFMCNCAGSLESHPGVEIFRHGSFGYRGAVTLSP